MKKRLPEPGQKDDDGPYGELGRDLASLAPRTEDDVLIMGIVDTERVREEIRHAAELADAAYPDSTKRAYRTDWALFERWCQDRGIPALPASPKSVAVYLASEAMAGKAVSTVQRRLAAIRFKHRVNGHLPPQDPVLDAVLRGFVREKGRAGNPKDPLLKADLETVVDAIPRRLSHREAQQRLRDALDGNPFPADSTAPRRGLADTRDRALLLVLFGGALRRSDVEAMRLGNLRFHEVSIERERTVNGNRTVEKVTVPALTATIFFSKTNKSGRAEEIPILGKTADAAVYCPVRAVKAWLAEAGLDPARHPDHPLFLPINRHGRLVVKTGKRYPMQKFGILPLSGDSIARAVKVRAEAAGLDPARFSAHSLRSGMLTSASDAGADLSDLMRQARHKSLQTTVRYVRPKDTWRRHPAAKIGDAE